MKNEYVRVFDKYGASLGSRNDWQITPDAFDYVIFKDGGMVKAKDAVDGVVEFSSTDASDVLQSVHDTSGGNVMIFIRDGTYTFTKSVLITKNNIEIAGARGATILRGSGIAHVFTSIDDSGYIHNPGRLNIHDLYVSGAGVFNGSTWHSRFYNLYISNDSGSGIALTDTSDPSGNCVDNWIYNNYIKAVTAISLNHSATDTIITNNVINAGFGGDGIRIDNSWGQQIIGNHIHGIQYSRYGIFLRRVKRAIVVANKIELSGTWTYGIYVATDVGVVAEHINIVGNQIYGASTNGVRGIWLVDKDGSGGPNNVLIVGNVLRGAFKYGISVPLTAENVTIEVNNFSGSYGTAKNNYLTRNKGQATFSGDGTTTQFTIAHGLVNTPNKVLVTPMSADAAGDFYVTADATNIYVNYKTAPSAGTDNIKLSWYAEV